MYFKKEGGRIYLVALNADDLLRDADPNTIGRSSACTPQIYRFDNQNAVVDAVTSCAMSRNSWEQRIQLMDYNFVVPEEERDQIQSFEQLISEYPDVINGDVKVFCNCPAFLYWGYKYLMTQLDTGLENEQRFPEVRNPALEGTVCKHLVAVLSKFFA